MIAETAEAEWVAVIWSVGLNAFGFFFGQAEGKGDAAVCKEGVACGVGEVGVAVGAELVWDNFANSQCSDGKRVGCEKKQHNNLVAQCSVCLDVLHRHTSWSHSTKLVIGC